MWFLRPLLLLAVASVGAALGSKNHNNLYSVLDVSKKASVAEIKRAYRRLSMKFHPDRNKEPGAADKFQEIAEAYEILADEEKRKVYDARGWEGLEELAGGERHHADFFDFFGFGRPQRRGQQKVAALTFRLYVTLPQLFFGDLLQVAVERPVLCLRSEDCIVKRPQCSGAGVATVTQQLAANFVVQNQMQDDSCVAAGKGWLAGCAACPNGPTEVRAARTSVILEPGMREGETIVHAGGGEQRVGFETGDVVFTIHEVPHAVYDRKGDDLVTTVYLTLLESLIGFRKSFPHIDRRPLELESEGVTHDGQLAVLRGKGMPTRDGRAFGDLHVIYRVQFPTELSSEQKELVSSALQDIREWRFEAPRLMA